MSKPQFLSIATLYGILAMAAATSLQAAELKLIAGGSMTASMNEIAPQFEKTTGHKLLIHFDSTPNIITLVTSGTPFDVVVVPVDVFKDAAAKARFAPGPTVDIARVGYGVIVRAGAPKPDISTPDAFTKTLLAASSIAYLPASAAGACDVSRPESTIATDRRPAPETARVRRWRTAVTGGGPTAAYR